MAELNFDATKINDDVYEVIPEGRYAAVITESELKENKKRNGQYLKLTFEIIEGAYKGRKVWAQLNLFHANAIAVEIAQKELASICRAVNVAQIRDSAELHNKPLVIGLKCYKNQNDEMQNEISKYYSRETAASTSPATPSGKALWQR